MGVDTEELGVSSTYTISEDTTTARREPLPEAATLTSNLRQNPTAVRTVKHTLQLLSMGSKIAAPGKGGILFHSRYARKVSA